MESITVTSHHFSSRNRTFQKKAASNQIISQSRLQTIFNDNSLESLSLMVGEGKEKEDKKAPVK
jgi:hypothetical protein